MKLNVRTICYVGLLTAVTSVLSILSIPTPWGVPFTLQTFAMALAGYTLGVKLGTLSTIVYVLLGAVGVPVFSNMKAGIPVLAGPTGGYLFGFIFMTAFCGLGMYVVAKNLLHNKMLNYLVLGLCSLIGLGIAYLAGTYRFMMVMNGNGKDYTFASAAAVATLPYMVKDIASMVLAYVVAMAVRRALSGTSLMETGGFVRES